MSLYDAIMKLYTDTEAGADAKVLWEDFKAIGDAAVGVTTFAAKPGEDIKAACDKATTAARARLSAVAADPAGGPKWDGTILKLILDALPGILALFM